MASVFSTAGLARISARRPWRVIAVWLVVMVLAGYSAMSLGDVLTTESTFTNNPESLQGDKLLEARMRDGGERPVTETVIVTAESATVDDPAFQAVVDATTTDLLAMKGVVASASNYYQAKAAGVASAEQMVSQDRQTTIIPVTLVGNYETATEHTEEYLAVVAAQNGDGIKVLSVGDASSSEAFNKISEEDLKKGEGIGIAAALVILVVVFGALVAAGVPLVLAVVSIFVAVGVTAVIGRAFELSFFVTNMISMIGLAVGIDYALFILERYREERRRGASKHAAIEIAGGTASKAVLFSGGTVVLALLGMFLIPTTIFRSLGVGAIVVVVVAVAAMLTLVPALLALIGDRIDWPRRRNYDKIAASQKPAHETVYHGFWGRLTRVVMARPVVSVVLAIALLVVAAVPYFDLNRGQSGVESLPESDVKTGYEILTRDFSAGVVAPVQVVIDGQNDATVAAGIEQLVAGIGQDATFGPVANIQWNAANDLALVEVPLKVSPSTQEAYGAIEHLRGDLVPAAFGSTSAEVYVSGMPAFNYDFETLVDDYTTFVFLFVLGLSFLLLTVAFRSIVVPAKAILMNLLSVGAAYGLLVLVFQKGYGADLFGFQQTPVIESWLPIFLFCVLFGLSMDYHVFLLSRIREHYDQTRNNTESVAVGLQATAKIITGAALIMVAVFSGFAMGRLVAFQQMGFGLAVAVLIDATIVRSILVPAAMALLGDRNWYLPRWLAWLPDLRIEGAPVQAPAPKTAPSSAGD